MATTGLTTINCNFNTTVYCKHVTRKTPTSPIRMARSQRLHRPVTVAQHWPPLLCHRCHLVHPPPAEPPTHHHPPTSPPPEAFCRYPSSSTPPSRPSLPLPRTRAPQHPPRPGQARQLNMVFVNAVAHIPHTPVCYPLYTRDTRRASSLLKPKGRKSCRPESVHCPQPSGR